MVERQSRRVAGLAVEGTVFWIVAATIFDLWGVYYLGVPFLGLITGIVLSIIYLALAYLCFILKPWAFIGASALALIFTASDVLIGSLRYPGDQLIAMLNLLVAFFGYRGYRELKQSERTKV